MRVKEIMKKVVVVEHDMPLKEAARIMSEKKIGSIVAVKSGKIFGILTEKDIVDNAENLGKRISEVIKKNVLTIEEEEDIDNAAMMMGKNKIKRLPVVDKNGHLTGIITATDLIANSGDLNEDFFLE